MLLAVLATLAGDEPPFELADGDRVVLVGNALIERDQEYGHLETLLTAAYPDRSITVRNLGWSGDTVFGEARAGFGSAEDGFRHLREHLLALKPTVVLVGYGGNEAFAGEAGLPRFREGLARLLDAIAETKARVVILAPIRQADLGRPFPDPARHNRDLKLYGDALRAEADRRGHRFVDLSDLLGPATGDRLTALTDDGLHLTDLGYRVFAEAVASALGRTPHRWEVAIDRDGAVEARGASVRDVERRPESVRFTFHADRLPGLPRPGGGEPSGSGWGSPDRLRVRGLPPGRYVLKVDGEARVAADADAWDTGQDLPAGPDDRQRRELERAIREKNRLYFYRWRPQNETYLFGFRKHEQGQNAREILRFDPLVAEQEAAIARLRVPVAHAYELVREEK